MAIEPISAFKAAVGRYPGNNKQWWVARSAADDPDTGAKAGDFLPNQLDKLWSGNNRAPRGHYVLNAFYKDRSAVSGVPNLAVESESTRATSVAFFAGRVWFAANSSVYFSQVLDHKSRAGLCYQEADPTAEDISDLIPSDGGAVPIPEATKIIRLMPFGNGVLVFAQNGVWFVNGGDAAFSAVNIAVGKISSFGTKNPLAIVQVGDIIFWWSEVGIQALEQAGGQFGPISGKFGNTNIAEQTIQSFYNAIPEKSKSFAKGVYDPKNNVVQWLYSSDENNACRYDSVLIFDITLQAFYPWKVTTADSSPEIAGAFLDVGLLEQTFNENVTTANGTVITTVVNVPVTTQTYQTSVENRPTNLTYTTCQGSSVTFSKFTDRSYVDWKTATGGLPYTSFIETGYELLNDAMRKKQATYVFVHFRRTEDDALGSETSCKMRTKWDWSANSFSNKWSREIEAYRPRQMRVETTADLESGFPVVISKNKVRGSGKSIQFRFECSEPNRNFDLLGWAVAYTGNTKP